MNPMRNPALFQEHPTLVMHKTEVAGHRPREFVIRDGSGFLIGEIVEVKKGPDHHTFYACITQYADGPRVRGWAGNGYASESEAFGALDAEYRQQYAEGLGRPV